MRKYTTLTRITKENPKNSEEFQQKHMIQMIWNNVKAPINSINKNQLIKLLNNRKPANNWI